jgi:hypothetical protein
MDAILHAYLRGSGAKNHKLEILKSGKKTLDEIGQIIASVFDVNPDDMAVMRIDCAADMFGIPLLHLHRAMRVKFKRSCNGHGELDYELVSGRRLEYFRYGKSPNCVRTYDKPAECCPGSQEFSSIPIPTLNPHLSQTSLDSQRTR